MAGAARTKCSGPVLMWWKLHLQGNVLDEIVGSIEDGGYQAAERLERQVRLLLELNENGRCRPRLCNLTLMV